MIKFFRRIRLRLLSGAQSDAVRQRMLTENPPAGTGQAVKFSKYLIYAIGEIVLVVIGILTALQLNNWNTERKEVQQELGQLVEMRENLTSDLEDAKSNIGMNRNLLFSNETVLKHLTESTSFHDSLRLHYGRLLGGTKQSTNTSTFDNLKSTGFDLIKNGNLHRSITTLYFNRYTSLRNQEVEVVGEIQSDIMRKSIYGKVVIAQFWRSGDPHDVVVLREDEVQRYYSNERIL